MPNELRYYTDIARLTASHITDGFTNWTSFLNTAGNLYKWPFEDQLLIYAQRPDASACADYAVWNRMGRYIRRDSRAIVLVDNSGQIPVPRYVFDFADTKSGANARVPWIWQYRDGAHNGVVSAALDEKYGQSGENAMEARLGGISEQTARDYWRFHREEILEAVPGSYLEEYDALNIETAFYRAASVSIAYVLLSRCGLEPDSFFGRQDFEHAFEFNTPDVVNALGSAVSECSEETLRVIEGAVKNYERRKQLERSAPYGTDLYASGRLPDSRHRTGRTAGTSAGQIRPDAQGFPAPAPLSTT